MTFQENNSDLSVHDVFYRLYPYNLFLKDGIKSVERVLSTMKVVPKPSYSLSLLDITNKMKATTKNPTGNNIFYIETHIQNKLINEMLESYDVGDFCIVGPRGCGKSILVSKIAEILGKETESIVLYQDMTSRDLVQQRTTLDNGDTVWRFSPLVSAALEGKIAVLDGIHRIHPSTLSVLHR